MSRADEPTTLPDGDDEITTDVDPAWVASIRADTNGSTPSPAVHDAVSVGDGDADDWALAEPSWDPEATVGVSDGLIERIRQEVRSAPVPLTTSAAAPPVSRPSPPPPILQQPRPAVPSVEELASTTVRWEPRQRLTATAPVTETPVIAAPTHHGLDTTKIVIALIAAVALVVVAWLVVGSRGGDDPAPSVGSVPTSDAGTGTVAPSESTPVDPEAPAEVGG